MVHQEQAVRQDRSASGHGSPTDDLSQRGFSLSQSYDKIA
jgi:hypothetical protein